jgi:energy-coupling factor transport system substrate-specific component
VFVETVAATVSALLGAQWGVSTIVYGVAQGLAVELVFAIVRYQRSTLPVAVIAGGAAGIAAAITDFVYYYAAWSIGYKIIYLAVVATSGAVIAGGLGWVLVRALARTGVLAPFPAGQEQRAT